MAIQSRTIQPGEVFFGEYDFRYTRISGTIENDSTTGAAAAIVVADPIGQPVVLDGSGQLRFANAAEVATGGVVTGFVQDGPPITDSLAANAITVDQYSIIDRGPALLNIGRIPAEDVYGDAINAAAYAADAELLNIKAVNSVADGTSSVQTT